MAKKIVALIVMIILLLQLLGCSTNSMPSDTSSKKEKETPNIQQKPLVVYNTNYNPYNPVTFVVKEASRLFTETYGIKVENYYSPSFEELRDNGGDVFASLKLHFEKLAADIMAGNGPDVFILDGVVTQGFPNLYKMFDAGAFYNLDIFIENDSNFDIDEYEKRIMDIGIYKGNRYVIPLTYDVNYLLTTNEKLDRYGKKPEDFSTYEVFLESWESIQSNGGFLTYKGFYDYFFTYECGWLNECLDYESSIVDFDSLNFKRIMDLLRNSQSMKRPGSNSEFIEDRELNKVNYENDEGLFFNCTSFVSSLAGNIEVLPVEKYSDAVILPVPNAKGSITAHNGIFAMVSSATENEDASWKYIKILLSDEIQSFDIVSEYGSFSIPGFAGLPVKSSEIDGVIDRMFESHNFSDVSSSGCAPVLKEKIKNLANSYDNAFLFFQSGGKVIVDYLRILYGNDFAYTDSEFEEGKKEIENYFYIYLSE